MNDKYVITIQGANNTGTLFLTVRERWTNEYPDAMKWSYVEALTVQAAHPDSKLEHV